jgi:hypothetical protein
LFGLLPRARNLLNLIEGFISLRFTLLIGALARCSAGLLVGKQQKQTSLASVRELPLNHTVSSSPSLPLGLDPTMESIVTLDYETWERERATVGKWGLSGHQLELLSGSYFFFCCLFCLLFCFSVAVCISPLLLLFFFFNLTILTLCIGFSAGVAGIVSGHPLDTVRVRNKECLVFFLPTHVLALISHTQIRMQTNPTREGVFSRLFKMVRAEGVSLNQTL